MKPIALASLTILIAAPLLISNNVDTKNPVTVHEWGTFTSIANADGDPVTWAPLFGKADLPCFVYRLASISKGSARGLVRMETPVLYFYAQHPATLSVHVDFPKGSITEWYPAAGPSAQDQFSTSAGQKGGRIDWTNIQVLPDSQLQFPASNGASHYYAARETDSAPLRVTSGLKTEQEKLLFYRGVGSFAPPIRPRIIGSGVDNGKLEIRNAGSATIPLVIAFENQGGKLGYRVVRRLEDRVTVDMPELNGNVVELEKALAAELQEFGLYKKEAAAMVNTWKDSWFEDGMRVFYILRQADVDPILPLKITPAPTSINRVFVGRVEVLSPWTRRTLEAAAQASDTATLEKSARFLEPFLQQAGFTPAKRQMINELLANVASNATSCIQ